MWEFFMTVWLAASGSQGPAQAWQHVSEARRVAVYKNSCSLKCREGGNSYIADTLERRAYNWNYPCIIKGGVAVYQGKALNNAECNQLKIF